MDRLEKRYASTKGAGSEPSVASADRAKEVFDDLSHWPSSASTHIRLVNHSYGVTGSAYLKR